MERKRSEKVRENDEIERVSNEKESKREGDIRERECVCVRGERERENEIMDGKVRREIEMM